MSKGALLEKKTHDFKVFYYFNMVKQMRTEINTFT